MIPPQSQHPRWARRRPAITRALLLLASLLASASWGAAWLRVSQSPAASPAKERLSSRRSAFLAAAAASLAGPRGASAAFFIGPVSMKMTDVTYEEVPCNADKGEGLMGTKSVGGLVPRCVVATASLTNPTDETFKRAGVFGRVIDKMADTSVLANAMDGATDLGQFALVETIPPGTSRVQFRFVASLPKAGAKQPIPPLTFKTLKATWYPGGSRFDPIGQCDLTPTAPECDPDLQ
uniref:Uncharacterized protein n=1 Tax=Alexandrium andersonii TaxID=327968 RepID=A0A7S2I7A4_9DINO|mmetsp:Transcript_79547/g.177893  ORF Transcript_79547/g.177893 Transcript_79547/m.177893 type:complete len:236 (+) Transcript_79547:47-754(+)